MPSLGPLGAGGGAGAGGGGAATGAAADSVRRRRVSVPCTGPRHVVPLYGIVSVLLPSEIVAMLFSEKAQLGMPGMLPVPVAVIFIVVPLTTVPDPLPLTITPSPHVRLNVPFTDVAVWPVTVHWKLPHDFGSGSEGTSVVCDDDQVPTIDAAICVELPDGDASLGAIGLDLCWRLHALPNSASPSITTAANVFLTDAPRAVNQLPIQ